MTNNKDKEIVEQRKRQRYQVQDDAFVVFTPHHEKLGHIIDISMDGLAFRYTDVGRPSNKSSELDMFFADNRFHLNKVPFETISNHETDSLMSLRRCGVQFGQLTDNQKIQLTHFIKTCTASRVQV